MIGVLILDYPEWSQPTVAQVLIPEAAYKLTPELEKIDKLLQDESYEDPIVERFNTQRGRPTVPVRVYIRMMFLKHYTGLSYEDLVPEVTHNLMYRFFCRIPLEQKVPDPTALMKITTRYGEEVIEEMNRNLLKALVQKKLLRPQDQDRFNGGGGQYRPPYGCGSALRRRKKAHKSSRPHKASLWEGFPTKYDIDP